MLNPISLLRPIHEKLHRDHLTQWCILIVFTINTFFVALPAQIQFEEILREPSFSISGDVEATVDGSVAFADVDNDDDLDLFVTGLDRFNNRVSSLYLNLDNHYYLDTENEFIGVSSSSIAFSDTDNDGDSDLLITGRSSSGSSVSVLYINTEGVFAPVLPSPFTGVQDSSIGFEDIDNDGDKDVVLSGRNGNQRITRLYLNSEGAFSLAMGTPFAGTDEGEIDFSDIDSDGDIDLLITGRVNVNPLAPRIYLNNQGNFSEMPNTSFPYLRESSAKFADVDLDGDEDFFISGRLSSNIPVTYLYMNIAGTFELSESNSFTGVYNGDIDIADIDNDGDQDLMIAGTSENNQNIAELYLNSSGSFSQESGISFHRMDDCSIAFADMDNDGDSDLLMVGNKGVPFFRSADFYENIDGVLRYVTDSPFEEVNQGMSAFSDIDNDGDQDLLISGINPGTENYSTKLYLSTDSGLTLVNNTPFSGIVSGSISFADVDANGFQDVLITGASSTGRVAELYLNSEGNFVLDTLNTLEGVMWSFTEFIDMDLDGDLDLLLMGLNSGGDDVALIYTNFQGIFFLNPFDQIITPLLEPDAAFADIDGDSDPDLIVSGRNRETSEDQTSIYMNNNGGFILSPNNEIEGFSAPHMDLGDVDNDGDPDLVISGFGENNLRKTELYLNHAGSFSYESGFQAIIGGSLDLFDLDYDGDKDLILTGSYFSSPRTRIYANNGLGEFSVVSDQVIADLDASPGQPVAFGDFDNDSFSDLILVGKNDFGPVTRLYRNKSVPLARVDGAISQYIPNCAAIDAQLVLVPSDSDSTLEVLEYNVSVSDASFLIDGIHPGTYDIYLKTNNSLREVNDSIHLSVGINNILVSPLRLGDINNDNIINALDFQIISNELFTGSLDENFNQNADLDCDGLITALDFQILSNNLFSSGAEVPNGN